MHLTIGALYNNGATSGDKLEFNYGHGNDNSAPVRMNTSFTDTSSFHYAAVVLEDADSSPSGTLYFNGSSVATDTGTQTGGRTNWDTSLRIGRPGTSERYFDGIVDEVRVSTTARSANWLAAQFLSMNNSFVTFGNEYNSNDPLDDTSDVNLTGAASGDRFGHSVHYAGDIDSDGEPDVIVGAPYAGYGYNDIITADASADQVTVYNGTSSGGWEVQGTLGGGDQPRWVFVGDANNDGLNDIVTADYNDNTVSIYNGTSSGGWESRSTLNVGTQPYSVFVGDANNDGYNDILTADRTDDTVTIYNGTSSGGWETKGTLGVGNSPRSVFVGDANNNGYNDILTADELDDTVTIYNGTSSGDWQAKGTLDVGNGPYTVFVGDGNNDGYNDILTADELDDTVTIYNGTSSGWEAKSTLDVGTEPISVFVGDANNDGYNDIITADSGADTVTIYNGTSSGGWQAKSTLSVGTTPWSVFVGDANNDGYNDILTADRDDDAVSIYKGKSSGGWEAKITRSTGSYPRSVFVSDANNDNSKGDCGAIYVYCGGSDIDTRADYDNYGNYSGDHFGWSVSFAGDLNKDGTDEVLVGAPNYNTQSGETPASASDAGKAYVLCVIIVIPEFNILTLPLVIFTIFIMCINRYYRSISNSKRDLNNKRRVKKTNKKILKIQQRYNK
jgi:hypothetical protein